MLTINLLVAGDKIKCLRAVLCTLSTSQLNRIGKLQTSSMDEILTFHPPPQNINTVWSATKVWLHHSF
ncbi:hypothetical protein XELAEV_18037303mg, partial [Xenopus laevis]